MMKKNLFQICGIALLVCLFAFVGSVSAQTVKTISTSGEWVVPTEDENHNPITVTSVTFEAWGGGGAGSYVNIGRNQRRNAGGGGGGGAYAKKTVNNPVGTYIITVGQGGTSIASTGEVTHGQATMVSYNGQTILSAAGGKSSVAANAGYNLMGAQGGQAADCIGDDPANGANGSNANIPSINPIASWTSGAGGHAGGASNPESGTGGASKSQSWEAWDFTGGSNGNPGLNYGGGGGGAIGFSGLLLGSHVAVNGGAGAQGAVRVTYTYQSQDIQAEDVTMELCANSSISPTFNGRATGSQSYTITLSDNINPEDLVFTYLTPAGVTVNSNTYSSFSEKFTINVTTFNTTTTIKYDTIAVTASYGSASTTFYVYVTTYAMMKAGEIAANQFVCADATISTLTSVEDATGGKNGSYQWQSKGTGSWTNISGATSKEYTPGDDFTGITNFKRVYKDEKCNTSGVFSNSVQVSNANPFSPGNMTVWNGSIDGDADCDNSTIHRKLYAWPTSGMDDDVNNPNTLYTYTWQKKVDNGNWQNISNATSKIYDFYLYPTDLQNVNTIEYRYLVHYGEGCTAVPSNNTYKISVAHAENYSTDIEDVTITLWYGALDTTFVDMEAPTVDPLPIEDGVEGPFVDQEATTLADGRYTIGEYTVYWKVIDPCNHDVVLAQNVTVEYPECGTVENGYKPVTDGDGKEYKTLRYVSETSAECWMIENLRTNIADGTYYDDDEAANGAFGKLYSWNAAVGSANGIAMKSREYAQGACPDGWAIPTQEQFNVLFGIFENDVMKLKTDDQSAWLQGEQGTNESKFAIMGAGYYDATATVYKKQLGYAGFWTADESVNIGSQATSASISYGCDNIENPSQNKANKLSIRCVRVTPYVTIQ